MSNVGNMEAVTKRRTLLRKSFTRNYNALDGHLKANKYTEARATFAILQKEWNKLTAVDEEILLLMMEDTSISEDDLERENVTVAGYETKYEIMNVMIQDIVSNHSRPPNDNESHVSSSSTDADHKSFHPTSLPRLNGLFDGQLKNWLPFWGQFEPIHEDESVPVHHKFRILVEGTKEGSRPRKILQSFPPSKDKKSYQAAVDALNERYGREDLLIEVYIREMLTIVISMAKSEKLELDELYDELEGHLRFLEILGVTSGKCAAILCPLLESCLTPDFLRAWQRSCSGAEVDEPEKRLKKLRSFMKAEVEGEQRILLAMERFGMSEKSLETSDKKPRPKQFGKRREEIPTAADLITQTSRTACIFCSQITHESADCFKARDMNLEDKLKLVRDSKCCYLCLKRTHSSKICRVKSSCALCDRKHAIILCPKYVHAKERPVMTEKSIASNVSGGARISTNVATNPVNVTTSANVTCDSSVLLPTVRVRLCGPEGRALTVRAVFDTAAQRSYILNDTAVKMGYKIEGQESLFHSLFGGRQTGMTLHSRYKIQLSKPSGGQVHSVDVLGQDEICGKLPTLPCGPWENELENCRIDLSDILNDSGPIELLLGADVACSMYTGNVYKLNFGTLVAVETVLGWTISGKLPTEFCKTTLGMLTTSMLVEEMNVTDLWKLEILGIEDPIERKTRVELQADVQRKFAETLKIDEDGRYEVGLPWKDEHSPLPTNYNLALKRMNSIYRKLGNDGFLADYDNVFQEWVQEGVIEEIPTTDYIEGGHFLPHRHVVKLNSTTKIRPVFDASAHENNSPSLNMCLEKGCNLIEQIAPLLIGFRLNRVGVIADIRRAFLQIGISPNDRHFLMFLWRDPLGNIKIYRHKRVVFGLTSSPFLLGAVIQHHLLKIQEKIEIGESEYSKFTIDTLLRCFYVDNAVTSIDSRDELETFMTEATSIMADGKFELRGWECTDTKLTDNTETSVLGMCWDRKNDTLSLTSESLKKTGDRVTKRLIMSAAHKMFDPLGFFSPVTLYPRLLVQELWEIKLGWDDEVPQHICKSFLNWSEEIHLLSDVKIPRWLPNLTYVSHWSIHTFCDACDTSYSAVVFLRVENTQGVNVQLIQSKARVAPKNSTIPRKELLAATIAARLYNSVYETIDKEYESHFWSDSSTVLAWLKREENWAPFVLNRVKEIRRLTKIDRWHHVPGMLNPADLPSRGCLGGEFVQSRWWEGPEWLYQPEVQWPSVPFQYDEAMISKERRKTGLTTTLLGTSSAEPPCYERYYRYFSQYPKIIRMVAWINRFLNNSRFVNSETCMMKRGPLSVEEFIAAEKQVLKMIQRETFQGVEDQKIATLSPFEDHDGLIRLKTKVSNRPDSEDFRYPILLPKQHPVVTRLIRNIHEEHCHVGVQGLLAITRERFWILGGRRALKTITSQCMVCKRYESKRLEAPTVPLPVDRVREAAAFEVVGVDLAGPIFLKKQKKAWICLFTCSVVRAIHLELILSLSTDDFLQALRRFVARRGRPARIYSDQGTNFVGANNLFRNIDWSQVLEYCNIQQISWKFNPPTAAWWGGWWERLVGLTKRLLRKVLKRSVLTYSEMATVLCDCESVLNSRPLTFMADGDSEATPITPSLFIQDIRESGLPELDVIEAIDLKKKLQQRRKLKEDFRARFRTEYLGHLQMRSKSSKHDQIKIGDIVLIGNDLKKRIDWPLACVVELLPGKDGITHLVRLKTNSGTCLRPVQRLYSLLEADETFFKGRTGKVIPSHHSLPSPPLSVNRSTRHIDQVEKEDTSASAKRTTSGRTVKKPSRFCE